MKIQSGFVLKCFFIYIFACIYIYEKTDIKVIFKEPRNYVS